MYECNSNNYIKIQNTCQICVTVNDNVRPITENEINLYKNLGFKSSTKTESTIHICTICGHLLKKFSRFLKQCQEASCALQAIQDVTVKPLHDFVTTPITINYIGPLEILEPDQEIDTSFDFDNSCSDEDLPLVMLRDDKNEDSESQHTETKLELEKDDPLKSNKVKMKKSKKELRDGFSSRMVQETEEYVVIKLTTEQVLQEMSVKRNSEKYKRALYKCEACVKGFNFEDVLRSHMEKHSEENGAYKCKICNQYCPSTVSLRGHMKSHTTRYKCKVCGDIRLSRQHLLEHHAISHTSEATEYTCEHCYFTTNKRTVIQRHVKTHKRNERHACHECGRLFQNIESLRVHTTRHDKTKSLQCSQCTRRFIYPSLLAKHIQSVHERADYYCVECDVRFKSPDNLRLHFKKTKKHRDSSSYTHKCPQCTEKFVTAASLSGHLTTIHGQPKTYSCDVCSRLYSSRESLKGHVRRVHGERQGGGEICVICSRSFSRKSVLTIHMRSHTGERPYSCACGAAFTQHSALRAHQAAKHPATCKRVKLRQITLFL